MSLKTSTRLLAAVPPEKTTIPRGGLLSIVKGELILGSIDAIETMKFNSWEMLLPGSIRHTC